MQDKQFVYKGNVLERLGDFVKKIRERYPHTELVHETPSEELLNTGKSCKYSKQSGFYYQKE